MIHESQGELKDPEGLYLSSSVLVLSHGGMSNQDAFDSRILKKTLLKDYEMLC